MHALMMPISNPLVNIMLISWFAAQFIKTVLHWVSVGNLELERMVGSGGMPSSHSSLVTSLTVGMARVVGFSTPIFALTLALAAIVMYDAMGVRRAAGEHAKTINKMIVSYKDFWDLLANKKLLDFDDNTDPDEPEKKNSDETEKSLKEFIGHTPLEVLAGALLGILVAVIYPI